MNYYDSELQRLQQEIMEKQRTDAKLSDLFLQQSDLEKRTEELQKTMQKEQGDVDRLNKRSITAFFYRTTGKMDEKLTKEEAEAYAAAVKYKAAESELRTVNEEIEYCGNSEAERILQIEEALAFHGNQQREIEEAINAGNCAFRIAQKILEDLDSAKKWSTVDLLGGNLIADMAKHDKINKVQDRIQDLQNALRGFRTELADVTERISGDLYVEIGDFLHFADYFFDGLFADWMVYDRINDSWNRTHQTCEQIQRVLEQLGRMEEEICNKQESLKKELEQTVLNS